MGMIPQHLKIKQHKELISHHPPLYCRDTISSATVWVSSLYVLHSPANISVIMRPADKKTDKHMIHEHTLAPKKHNARMTINAKHCNILRTFFYSSLCLKLPKCNQQKFNRVKTNTSTMPLLFV